MQELSVTDLVKYLKFSLDNDYNLQNINVIGEISNFHRHYSGHIYFSLKDDNSAINCVMFKTNAYTLNFEPKNGDKVLVKANTSLFETTGQLQLYVSKISNYGKGELYEKYEALKKKLTLMGIFDEKHKINISTKYPSKIAILCGDKSAAMSDIKIAFERRWPICQTDYYPVLVQGSEASKDICDKLKKVDELSYDAIILARGGGSFEDLFCFNDEQLVMTIYNLKTFIVTGIGHERDFSLSDFAADLRAATPTACVELITPNILELEKYLDELTDNIRKLISHHLNNINLNYDYLTDKLFSFQSIVNFNIQKIDNYNLHMSTLLKKHIQLYQENIKQNIIAMNNSINNNLDKNRYLFKRYDTLLKAYSSQNILDRGYSLIIQDNKIISRKKKLKKKDFEVYFADGKIIAHEKEIQ